MLHISHGKVVPSTFFRPLANLITISINSGQSSILGSTNFTSIDHVSLYNIDSAIFKLKDAFMNKDSENQSKQNIDVLHFGYQVNRK